MLKATRICSPKAKALPHNAFIYANAVSMYRKSSTSLTATSDVDRIAVMLVFLSEAIWTVLSVCFSLLYIHSISTYHLQKLLLSEMIIQSYVLLHMDKLLLLFGGQCWKNEIMRCSYFRLLKKILFFSTILSPFSLGGG